MLAAMTGFVRRQLDLYKTDAVAVYAHQNDLSAKPICDELKRLYQGKKEIIFQELERLVDIRSKRLTDIKYHFWLMPEEYGRISNVINYLPLFDGQKVIVIQTCGVAHKVRELKPQELEGYYSYIGGVEENMLKAIVDGHEPGNVKQIIARVTSSVLLYDFGFKAKDYEERLLRFVGLPSVSENATAAVNNKRKSSVPQKFEVDKAIEHTRAPDTDAEKALNERKESKRLKS